MNYHLPNVLVNDNYW